MSCDGCKKSWTCEGSGPLDAKMLLVAEWPSEEDALASSPLTSGMGKVVAWALKQAGISREEIRIEYAMRCGPWWRVPSPKIVKQCSKAHLQPTISLMRNLRCIVTLGPKALEAVTGCRNLVNTTKQSGWAGSVLDVNDVKLMQTLGQQFVWPSNACYLLPTYSAKFLMEGNRKYLDVFRHHLAVAQDIALTGRFDRIKPEYKWLKTSEELDDWFAGQRVVALDLETTMDWSKIELLGLSGTPGKAICMDWTDGVRDVLKKHMALDYQWVMHNAAFDEARLNESGIRIAGPIWDSMVGASAFASHIPVALGFVGPLYTGVAQWKHLSATDMVTYNCTDVDVTRRLYDIQVQQFHARGFYEHARQNIMPARGIFLRLEQRGMRVDLKVLNRMKAASLAEEKELENDWSEKTDGVNQNSPPQKVEYFFGKLKVRPIKKWKTKKGSPSLSKDALEDYAEKYPKIEEFQILRRLGSIAALRKNNLELDLTLDGRHHPHYALVSRTGRATSGEDKLDPTKVSATGRFNSMNIPVPYREVYIPDEGYEYCEVDYSGIEFHILAALSNDQVALDILASGQKIHGLVAADAFKSTYDEVMAEYKKLGGAPECMYQKGKKVRHSMSYGAGDRLLAQMTKLPERDCYRIKKAEREMFKDIHDYKMGCIKLGKEQGYLDNPFGRRCLFPEQKPTDMLAFIPQSTAFDVAIDGLVRLDAADVMVAAFTHDSFLMMVKKGTDHAEFEAKVRGILEREYPQVAVGFIPRVDFAWGMNWKDCK